jgi:hypothetical protein
MSEQARRYAIPPTTRRPHSTHKRGVLDFAPAAFLEIIPATAVQKLSEQLDGGLCSICLNL